MIPSPGCYFPPNLASNSSYWKILLVFLVSQDNLLFWWPDFFHYILSLSSEGYYNNQTTHFQDLLSKTSKSHVFYPLPHDLLKSWNIKFLFYRFSLVFPSRSCPFFSLYSFSPPPFFPFPLLVHGCSYSLGYFKLAHRTPILLGQGCQICNSTTNKFSD